MTTQQDNSGTRSGEASHDSRQSQAAARRLTILYPIMALVLTVVGRWGRSRTRMAILTANSLLQGGGVYAIAYGGYFKNSDTNGDISSDHGDIFGGNEEMGAIVALLNATVSESEKNSASS